MKNPTIRRRLRVIDISGSNLIFGVFSMTTENKPKEYTIVIEKQSRRVHCDCLHHQNKLRFQNPIFDSPVGQCKHVKKAVKYVKRNHLLAPFGVLEGIVEKVKKIRVADYTNAITLHSADGIRLRNEIKSGLELGEFDKFVLYFGDGPKFSDGFVKNLFGGLAAQIGKQNMKGKISVQGVSTVEMNHIKWHVKIAREPVAK